MQALVDRANRMAVLIQDPAVHGVVKSLLEVELSTRDYVRSPRWVNHNKSQRHVEKIEQKAEKDED